MERRISWSPGRRTRRCGRLAFGIVALALSSTATAAAPGLSSTEVRYTVRVGYQPYFAEAWSGTLVRALRLHADRLPRGVAVEFRVGMTGGGTLAAALRHGEVDLAYLGLAPTLNVTQDLAQGDFRIIAVASVSRRLCNVILAQPGTSVATREAALNWLDRRQVAVPDGTCADFFLGSVLERAGIHPARVINEGFDVLATSFREHRVDAVAVWEPMATELVRTAGAVRLIDGEALDEPSATFLVASAALLRDHPDVVRGWLRAERAAQRIMARSTDSSLPVDALGTQVADFSRETLLAVWSGQVRRGPWIPPASFPFAVTPDVAALLARTAGRMSRRGRLGSPVLRAGTVADTTARAVLAETESAPPATVRSGR